MGETDGQKKLTPIAGNYIKSPRLARPIQGATAANSQSIDCATSSSLSEAAEETAPGDEDDAEMSSDDHAGVLAKGQQGASRPRTCAPNRSTGSVSPRSRRGLQKRKVVEIESDSSAADDESEDAKPKPKASGSRSQPRTTKRRNLAPSKTLICHQDHQPKDSSRISMLVCTNLISKNGKETSCSRAYCGPCIAARYNDVDVEATVAYEEYEWTCYHCRQVCNCSLCRRKSGEPPLGVFSKYLKSKDLTAAGFLAERESAVASASTSSIKQSTELSTRLGSSKKSDRASKYSTTASARSITSIVGSVSQSSPSKSRLTAPAPTVSVRKKPSVKTLQRLGVYSAIPREHQEELANVNHKIDEANVHREASGAGPGQGIPMEAFNQAMNGARVVVQPSNDHGDQMGIDRLDYVLLPTETRDNEAENAVDTVNQTFPVTTSAQPILKSKLASTSSTSYRSLSAAVFPFGSRAATRAVSTLSQVQFGFNAPKPSSFPRSIFARRRLSEIIPPFGVPRRRFRGENSEGASISSPMETRIE